MNVNFKSHLGLFNYNFFSNISTKLWVWISLHLIFNTIFFILINKVIYTSSYFTTRLTWTILGTTSFLGYLFFTILSLIKIFKEDINNGMNIIFLSKSFNKLTLYLNKIISLFILCFCYGLIFFIHSIILSFFVVHSFQIMIININGYLLLTQITVFFLTVGISLWIKLSSKGLIIAFSLIVFLIFPLTVIVTPGLVGNSMGQDYSGITNYNSLTDKDLNLYKQAKYLFAKHGKDKNAIELSKELKDFFEINFSKKSEIPERNGNGQRAAGWPISKENYTKDEISWNSLVFHRLFTGWSNPSDVQLTIIKANSLQNAYDNAVSQVNKIKKENPNDTSLWKKLDFYLDLLKFAINNETPVIESMKNGDYKNHERNNNTSLPFLSDYKDEFYTPLIFEYDSVSNKQIWSDSNDFVTVAFNCFLTYSFTFYTKLIDPNFLEVNKTVNANFDKYNINKEIFSRFVMPNYFNIFRQMQIMWQRPSLTKWNYEMKLKNQLNYFFYNFINNHDFIPYYTKDEQLKRDYIDIEKSGYQFNMPTMYICYLLVGIGLVALNWLSYRRKDLV